MKFNIMFLCIVLIGSQLFAAEAKKINHDSGKAGKSLVISRNEVSAVRRCKYYSVAQAIFKKGNYSQLQDKSKNKWYSSKLITLYALEVSNKINGRVDTRKVQLISKKFAEATAPDMAFQGYYFVVDKATKNEHRLYAIPAKYGETGIHTLYVNTAGMIRAKDFGGKIIASGTKADETWFDPESTKQHKSTMKDIKPNTHSGSRIVRPEDRGEDFTKLSDEVIAAKLVKGNTVEQRKAARIIGDKILAGESVSKKMQLAIDEAVKSYINMSTSKDSRDRSEAQNQIIRLWTSAVPVLLENVDNKDELTKADLARRTLLFMRNENIIKALIEKYKSATHPDKKALLKFTLLQMKRKRYTTVPNRENLSKADSESLYEKLIAPVISK